jgi:hypothetical protein
MTHTSHVEREVDIFLEGEYVDRLKFNTKFSLVVVRSTLLVSLHRWQTLQYTLQVTTKVAGIPPPTREKVNETRKHFSNAYPNSKATSFLRGGHFHKKA